MDKTKLALLSATLTASVSLFSCSSDDGGGSDKYAYCVYVAQEFCLTGSYSSCDGDGIPSNSCPYDGGSAASSSSYSSSSSVVSSSSGEESSSSGAPSSSSSSLTLQTKVFWELAEDGGTVVRRGLAGFWFSYDDRNENGSDGKGGCMKTSFPPADPACNDDIVSSPWKANPEITYYYEGDCTYWYPYAGIGFTLAEAECPSNGLYPIATASPSKVPGKNGGIKVWYKLEGNGYFTLEISTADSPDAPYGAGITGYDELAINMRKGDFLEEGREFLFEDFNQEGWGIRLNDFSEALNAITGFRFKGDFRPSRLDVTNDEKSARLTITKMAWIEWN